MSRVDIWVLGFEPGWSESPSEGLRRVFGMDMQEALTLELTVPTPVKRVDAADADGWIRALRSIGAEVEGRPAESGVPPAFDLSPPQGVAPASGAIEGMPQAPGGADVFEGPPGLVMPSRSTEAEGEAKAKAKAKAKAEVAALAGTTKRRGGGAIKEEVVRVIRTPSVPQDRRPPPARKASQPALVFDPPEMAAETKEAKDAAPEADPFGGELDIAPPPKKKPAAAKTTKTKKAKKAKKAKGPGSADGATPPPSRPSEATIGSAFDDDDDDPSAGGLELELEDVGRHRDRTGPTEAARATQPARVVEGASKGRDLGIGLVSAVVGLVALYVGVMRYQSSLLGTGSYVTWIGDAIGYGGILYGLVHIALTLFGREPELSSTRLGGAIVLGFGIAFGVAMLRGPNEDALAGLAGGGGETVDGRQFISEPKARLADSSPEEAQAIVDAAFEGGAVGIEVGHIQSFMGRKVGHALVIEMPASGGARAHMAALLRRGLGAERATLAAEVPDGTHWVVPLRR